MRGIGRRRRRAWRSRSARCGGVPRAGVLRGAVRSHPPLGHRLQRQQLRLHAHHLGDGRRGSAPPWTPHGGERPGLCRGRNRRLRAGGRGREPGPSAREPAGPKTGRSRPGPNPSHRSSQRGSPTICKQSCKRPPHHATARDITCSTLTAPAAVQDGRNDTRAHSPTSRSGAF